MNKICLELKMMNLEVTKKILAQNGHYKTPDKLEVFKPVSYTHLRAHETKANRVCRLVL